MSSRLKKQAIELERRAGAAAVRHARALAGGGGRGAGALVDVGQIVLDVYLIVDRRLHRVLERLARQRRVLLRQRALLALEHAAYLRAAPLVSPRMLAHTAAFGVAPRASCIGWNTGVSTGASLWLLLRAVVPCADSCFRSPLLRGDDARTALRSDYVKINADYTT